MFPYLLLLKRTHPLAQYTLGDFCIDEHRPLKVIVIGAGFGGITAGIRLRRLVYHFTVDNQVLIFGNCTDSRRRSRTLSSSYTRRVRASAVHGTTTTIRECRILRSMSLSALLRQGRVAEDSHATYLRTA